MVEEMVLMKGRKLVLKMVAPWDFVMVYTTVSIDASMVAWMAVTMVAIVVLPMD